MAGTETVIISSPIRSPYWQRLTPSPLHKARSKAGPRRNLISDASTAAISTNSPGGITRSNLVKEENIVDLAKLSDVEPPSKKRRKHESNDDDIIDIEDDTIIRGDSRTAAIGKSPTVKMRMEERLCVAPAAYAQNSTRRESLKDSSDAKTPITLIAARSNTKSATSCTMAPSCPGINPTQKTDESNRAANQSRISGPVTKPAPFLRSSLPQFKVPPSLRDLGETSVYFGNLGDSPKEASERRNSPDREALGSSLRHDIHDERSILVDLYAERGTAKSTLPLNTTSDSNKPVIDISDSPLKEVNTIDTAGDWKDMREASANNGLDSKLEPITKKRTHKSIKSRTTPKSLRTVTKAAINQFNDPGFTASKQQKDVLDDPAPALYLLDPSVAPKEDKQNLPKSKSRSKSKAKKKPTNVCEKLFPPDMAQERFGNQDFDFGTSSQLTADKETRDLRQAIEESKAMLSPVEEVDLTRNGSSSISRLWMAGNRDEEGSLLTAEPSPAMLPFERVIAGASAISTSTPTSVCSQKSKLVVSNASRRPFLACANYLTHTLITSPRHPLDALPSNVLAAPNASSRGMATTAEIKDTAMTKIPNESPRKRGRPRKDSSGVKSPTSRGTRVSKAKHTDDEPMSASGEMTRSSKPCHTRTKKQLRDQKRTEAKQSSTKRSKTDSEIPVPVEKTSSAPQDSPKTKRRKQRIAREMRTKTERDRLAAALFPAVSRAIRAQPRSNDLKHPIWWEKILLYDPIVVEDLAAWLNSGVLKESWDRKEGKQQQTGSVFEWDGKDIDTLLVQRWCEENSICCLWREGLRGGVKLAY